MTGRTRFDGMVATAGRWLALLTLAGLLGACGGSGGGGADTDDSDQPDTITTVDLATDTGGEPDLATDLGPEVVEGVFGAPCEEATDCLSALCVPGPGGALACSETCDESCPEGWECRRAWPGTIDAISLCLGASEEICAPCEIHDDCANPADRCVPVGPEGERFCTTGCSLAGHCPEDYTCTPVTVGPGVTLEQCLPDTDSCLCPPGVDGTERDCERVSAFGNCPGSQTCDGVEGWSDCDAPMPVAEACDGLDNNCDGDTDEGFRWQAADGTRIPIGLPCGLGPCAGTVVCADESAATCDGLVNQRPETCDGLDNDCDGETDEDDDCPSAGCGLSGIGYAERGDSVCQAGECQGAAPVSCGAFTCEDGGGLGERCATSCLDDSTCLFGHHCDVPSGACLPDVENGAACVTDADCGSRHCRNGRCCAAGDCCAADSDCPAPYTGEAVCHEPWRCQGTRRVARCDPAAFVCHSVVVDDDSACAGQLARTCAPYPDRFCTDEVAQGLPACLATCADDSFCAAGYHCDGTCRPDLPDGAPCRGSTSCASGHCAGGLCCAGGDCCRQASDCPTNYAAPASCEDESACQGHRLEAACVAYVCQSRPVDDDSACGVEIPALDCGLYHGPTCESAPVQPARSCPESCTDDLDCVEGAGCLAGACLAAVGPGEICDSDGDCAAGVCGGGRCCAGGDCCATADDCPDSYRAPPVCDEAATCQGHRVDAACVDNVCAVGESVDDDSACDASVTALDCGALADVACTGAAAQSAPLCPEACAADQDCDAGHHCDEGACAVDLADGLVCEEDSDCASGHCGGGRCCAGGDCCATAVDCPASYTQAPACLDPFACQGAGLVATCVNAICGSLPVEDDSPCDATVLADECGRFPAVFCTGEAEQVRPLCAADCAVDEDCDEGSSCDTNGLCVGEQGEGGVCVEPGDCATGHCEGGFCCTEGACCATSADCAALAAPSVCHDPALCAGERLEAWCDATSRCATLAVADDSGCDETVVAADCAPYAPASCDGGHFQVAASCAEGCENEEDCAAEADCVGGLCLPWPGPGAPCDGGSPCAGGLACADGVCCATACEGACERCDLPGAEGICTPVPAGHDPDDECGGLSCEGFFAGWEGATCFAAADASDLQVGCDGAGACEQAAAICPFTGPAAEATRCEGFCEEPDAASCQGATPGACATADQGSLDCGVGACARTVPRCLDGQENTCAPGEPSDEVCNGVDDDCDGRTDEPGGDGDRGLAHSGLPPCALQDGACAGARHPAYLCRNGAWEPCGPAEYLMWNSDYEGPEERSCDGVDNDCDRVIDEPFADDPQNCGGCGVVCRNAFGATACVDGQCAPTCDATHRDCDGDPTNGCERSVRTLSDCGQCGRACDIPGALASCESGACTFLACARGFADCNGSLDDGCETEIGGAATCPDDLLYLGEACADLNLGSACAPNCRAFMAPQRGRGGAWFRLRANECSTCLADTRLWLRLQVPDEMNYDLRVYDTACPEGTRPPVAQSLSPAGQDEIVAVTSTERAGTSQDADYWVEVTWSGGSACGQWVLEAYAGCADSPF